MDLLEDICERVAEKPITVGFLGGGPKIAEITAERLLAKYPNLKINFVGQEWGNEGFGFVSNSKFKIQSSKLQFKIKNLVSKTKDQRQKTIDILFVAFGAPKQEMWMAENLDKLPVKVMMGVGGAFDYLSGKVPRAPILIRRLGFEWLFRLIVQPWRIKRQLALLEFIWLVVNEKMEKS